jgi:hypothetical protein
MGLREIKAQARRDLHEAMQVPAYYYATVLAAPVPVNVRVHTKFNQQLGDLKGTSFSYAETEAQLPRLVFWRAEVDPDNNALIMIGPEEGYRINHVHEPDGPTRTAEVSFLDAAERAALSYPGA